MIWVIRVGDAVLKYLRDEIEHHPANEHELSLEKENDSLQTIDGCQHNNCDERKWCLLSGDGDDEVDKLVDPIIRVE